MTLILKHANKNRLGSIDWGQTISMYGGRPRYRANISVTAGTARTPVVLDNHCSRASADDAQLRVFSEIEHSLPHTDPVRAMLVQPYFLPRVALGEKGLP